MNNTHSEDNLIIVTGLPRSGTSLVMQILCNIGVPILYDNLKPADEHNPYGYYECEKVRSIPTSKNWEWLKSYPGYAVKIISPILINIPIEFPCKVILITRKIEEVITSQERMVNNRKSKFEREYLKKIYLKHISLLKNKLKENPWVKMMEICFRELLYSPSPILQQLSLFLGVKINIEEVSKVIDPALYRVRCKE